jgi:hypothetical protein
MFARRSSSRASASAGAGAADAAPEALGSKDDGAAHATIVDAKASETLAVQPDDGDGAKAEAEAKGGGERQHRNAAIVLRDDPGAPGEAEAGPSPSLEIALEAAEAKGDPPE